MSLARKDIDRAIDEAFEAPDNRQGLLEAGLRHFAPCRESRRGFLVLYTDTRRSTPGWRGLKENEVQLLVERGYARLGAEEAGGKQAVTLTPEGKAARDALLTSGHGAVVVRGVHGHVAGWTAGRLPRRPR